MDIKPLSILLCEFNFSKCCTLFLWVSFNFYHKTKQDNFVLMLLVDRQFFNSTFHGNNMNQKQRRTINKWAKVPRHPKYSFYFLRSLPFWIIQLIVVYRRTLSLSPSETNGIPVSLLIESFPRGISIFSVPSFVPYFSQRSLPTSENLRDKNACAASKWLGSADFESCNSRE